MIHDASVFCWCLISSVVLGTHLKSLVIHEKDISFIEIKSYIKTVFPGKKLKRNIYYACSFVMQGSCEIRDTYIYLQFLNRIPGKYKIYLGLFLKIILPLLTCRNNRKNHSKVREVLVFKVGAFLLRIISEKFQNWLTAQGTVIWYVKSDFFIQCLLVICFCRCLEFSPIREKIKLLLDLLLK